MKVCSTVFSLFFHAVVNHLLYVLATKIYHWDLEIVSERNTLYHVMLGLYFKVLRIH